ncbi:MAG TPA: DUF2218 domain-containing protein [Geminicoccus sp.]|uniref:DUF2218 domain-containing protein n=1 Tax=Geminicoccus sp. TaxID=2024832 RepID=UPI002C2F2759|nr:DUF2218 domain-containing protein [Geminicoccus sp.]HWL71072.1 DUF2218 domain-containing protein [Geminicoccus sp.]
MNTGDAMLSSEARVPTAVPSRYLQQLCKHFQHKLPAEFDPRHGRVAFPAGQCELAALAEAGILHLRVTARDEKGLARLEDVVGRHLERFAFREKPEIHWTRAA